MNSQNNIIEPKQFRKEKSVQEDESSPEQVMSMHFKLDDKIVMTVRSDGVMIPGPGLSEDQATRKMFDCIASLWMMYMEGQKPVA